MRSSLHPGLGGVEQAPRQGGNDVLTKFGPFEHTTTRPSSCTSQKISVRDDDTSASTRTNMADLTQSTSTAVSASVSVSVSVSTSASALASASASSPSSLESLESPGDISPLKAKTPSSTTASIAAVIATAKASLEEKQLQSQPQSLSLSQSRSPSRSPSQPTSLSTSQSNSQQSRQGHQRGAASHDLVPTQTILKALASTASASLPGSSLPQENMCPRGGAASSSAAASPQQLAEALQDLAKKRSAPASAIANMLSPCFYHQRFDDAVDIDRVLEEIKNDGFMSHSRLVQTAISVREVSKQLQRRPIKRAVRNVMIVTKARDNHLVYLTRELASWLLQTPRYGSDTGVNVYVDAKLRTSKRFDATRLVAEDPRFADMLKYWTPDLCWSQPENFDLVITLGGDGTVLFTSWLFQRIVPPVLSFSLGSLGFMTTFEFEHYKRHLNRVMGDDGMKINLRMRFTCTVWRQDSGRSEGCPRKGDPMDECEQFEVLNELVIDRGPSPYVSNLELYGDDELLTVVQADGCIFSTPTGSTAYSLSAGGSLVHPDIPAILLTPICPHTLSFRPMVLSDTMALRVVVPRSSRATAYCAFDGKGRIELRQGDHVTITASQYPFPTVTRTDTEWFDSVSRTLRWNVRAAAQKPFDAAAAAATSGLSSEAGDDGQDASWDIDTDSACYTTSEEGSVAASPVRRQMSMLGL